MDLSTGDGSHVTGGGMGGAIAAMMGALMAREDKGGDRSMIIASMVVIVLIFIIAIIIIAFAFMRNDRREPVCADYGRKSDIAEALMAMAVANNCNKGYDHDHLEIKEKLNHNETNSEIRKTQSEIGAFGMLTQKTLADNEKTNLVNFATLQNEIGQLKQGMTTVLTDLNNKNIASETAKQFMMMFGFGMPCMK